MAVIFVWRSHEKHPIARPWGRDIGCSSWMQGVAEVLPTIVLCVYSCYRWPRYIKSIWVLMITWQLQMAWCQLGTRPSTTIISVMIMHDVTWNHWRVNHLKVITLYDSMVSPPRHASKNDVWVSGWWSLSHGNGHPMCGERKTVNVHNPTIMCQNGIGIGPILPTLYVSGPLWQLGRTLGTCNIELISAWFWYILAAFKCMLASNIGPRSGSGALWRHYGSVKFEQRQTGPHVLTG